MVDPAEEKPVAADADITQVPSVRKMLMAEWMTAIGLLDVSIANYEGMCLGPRLADGGQVIVLIADSQNQYAGVLSDWIKTLVIYF